MNTARINSTSGSAKLGDPTVLILVFIGFVLLVAFISLGGFVSAVALLLLPFGIVYLNRLFANPSYGITTILILGFTAIGLTRYIQGVPLGLSVDVTLVLTYIALFFRYFNEKIDWGPAKNDLTLLAFIWFMYSILQFFNPVAASRVAWFYAMRGMSLYFFLIIPLAFLLFNKMKHLNQMLYIWAVFSILATIRGWMQINIGLDRWEQHWIDTIGGVTHVLWGQLRAFSFMSDAGQFGAAQAHAGVVGAVMVLYSKKVWQKVLFFIMAIFGAYGMIISGTRGALVIPFFGMLLYLIYRRNFLILFIGAVVMAGAYGFFRFTWIGESNQHIRRMRTAVRPLDDASLMVRLETRQLLGVYLADKPFGGGIGSAGDWGRRFTPHTFLANIATDSWYVQIWAEQGIVGLMLHLFILGYVMIKASYLTMTKIKVPEVFGKMTALAGGILGIMAASYGNGVLGQLPTGPLIYLSMAFLFMGPKLDKEMQEAQEYKAETVKKVEKKPSIFQRRTWSENTKPLLYKKQSPI